MILFRRIHIPRFRARLTLETYLVWQMSPSWLVAVLSEQQERNVLGCGGLEKEQYMEGRNSTY